ncbi:MAG: YcxB family protein [Burkholderiales bacterium]
MRLSFELSWSDAGFTARDSNGQYTTPWSDFFKSKEDGRLFLLYYSDLLISLGAQTGFSE